MRFVFDASPLIHLAKAGLTFMIETMHGEKYTVPEVFREVVETGKALGYADASIVEQLVTNKILKVRTPKTNMQTISKAHKDIHIGEAQVIVLSKEINAIAILDDSVARSVAKIHNVRTEGTYSIILGALVNNLIKKEEAEASLQKLVSSGWRCDIELYNRLLKIIRETH